MTRTSPRAAPTVVPLENLFVQALVRAGTCAQHAKHISTRHKAELPSSQDPATPRENPGQEIGKSNKEEFPHKIQSRRPFRRRLKQFAERELKALVDYYGIEFDTRPEDEPKDDGMLVWNVGDDHVQWPLRDEADAAHIKRLKKLLENEETPHEDVFDTYKKLPSPGVVYLGLGTIRALLHHLSVVERPTIIAMQRFLSVLEDMKTAHIHIVSTEWTTAIHLAGHAMGQVSMDDLQSALRIWMDMEQRAGVKGGFVTLNVLFHIAVRAGKFTLAESFMKEMQARQVPMHRHHRVSLIYYYGVLQDGDAVRRTYQELVAAGDIVDTAVMNAVIAALIRAGEPSAAEHVFERMKRLHAAKLKPAPGHKFFTRTWRDRRALALHFTHEARRLNKTGEHDKLKELQDYAPIAPDSRTYALLIRYQSSTAGNMDRVYELLQEMRYNSVPLEGTIFIVIFNGFHTFGGVRYTSWTRDKLEKIWAQYLKALSEGFERTWLSTMAVSAALRAFGRCTDPDRTLKAWQDIRQMWQPNEEELENVMTLLRKLIPNRDPTGFFDENPSRRL
jgi:pentatricopeptide repeat protein